MWVRPVDDNSVAIMLNFLKPSRRRKKSAKYTPQSNIVECCVAGGNDYYASQRLLAGRPASAVLKPKATSPRRRSREHFQAIGGKLFGQGVKKIWKHPVSAAGMIK
jgi:hypothetical protein